MIYIDDLDFPRAKELEFYDEEESSWIPGYLLECTDGHTYLIFGPDMDAVKHMHAYYKLFKMAKTRMSDHDYDPERLCFRPAFTSHGDGHFDHSVFEAPASEMGKIYIVE